MSAAVLTQDTSDSDLELYWSCIDSNGLLKLPQNVTPEIRQRIELIHSKELNANRIVWTGFWKKDFRLYIFNNHPIISIFKCDRLHCFTGKQRLVNFSLVTMYSLFWTFAIAQFLKIDPQSSPGSSKCSNSTQFTNVTSCEAANADAYKSPAIAEVAFTFVFIKFPRSAWLFIVEKLATCRYGHILSYTASVVGCIVFAVLTVTGAVTDEHFRNALVGYFVVVFYDYEPLSTFLLFRWYHRNIMQTGHYNHRQRCFLRHACDSDVDPRVRMLDQTWRSVSLVNAV
jgi:hypothetical protein